ncbi:hypothetical protein M513_01278 [Trichuris suis]|uniref:ZP domain-containing protein n=1 Tax=Trichuris suis TaxID=68888 RepID=A0A085MLE9_9BILA|nr:hypothetical protein M513_01278 [Trichuris suis]
MYCMLVHSCTADDGEGELFTIIDENGCSKDNFILTDLSYLGDMEAGVESHIFKFADKPHVYFTCQVRLLIKREQPSQVCPKPICSFPSNPRNKRDLSKANTNSILGAIPKSRSTDIDIMASPILVLDLDLQHQNVVRGLSRSSAETETTSAEEYTYQKKKQTEAHSVRRRVRAASRPVLTIRTHCNYRITVATVQGTKIVPYAFTVGSLMILAELVSKKKPNRSALFTITMIDYGVIILLLLIGTVICLLLPALIKRLKLAQICPNDSFISLIQKRMFWQKYERLNEEAGTPNTVTHLRLLQKTNCAITKVHNSLSLVPYRQRSISDVSCPAVICKSATSTSYLSVFDRTGMEPEKDANAMFKNVKRDVRTSSWSECGPGRPMADLLIPHERLLTTTSSGSSPSSNSSFDMKQLAVDTSRLKPAVSCDSLLSLSSMADLSGGESECGMLEVRLAYSRLDPLSKSKDELMLSTTEFSGILIRVYLVYGPKVLRRKTSIQQAEEGCVRFNESMIFSLSQIHLNRVYLRVSVREAHSLTEFTTIGHVTVGARCSGKEFGHWQRMMDNPTAPLTMWHKLLAKPPQ